MEPLNLICAIDKLFLLASALDTLLTDEYATLLRDTGHKCRNVLNIVATGLGEIRHDLEYLVTTDLLALATDDLLHSFPVDNGADSGYDKHENDEG